MNIESKKLALLGGERLINNPLRKYNSIGKEEAYAANKVIESGVLSRFLGSWSDDFYGGSKVKDFEEDCKSFFKVKHAITVNSWTSGLIASMGAIGLEPGDEVITTPWTMCATATSIIHWNAIPIFADIDPLTFNINPESVEKKITNKTKAILAVDIFGQSCDVDALMKLGKKYDLKVMTDSAQSPGSYNSNRLTGTISHIGGYSLNYHKHINTGEGGIVVTNDDDLCERVQLIRNHGEAVVEKKGVKNIKNIIGHNFRLGEIECAIGIEQLKKLEILVNERQNIANKLAFALKNLDGLNLPYLQKGNTHAYYVYGLTLDLEELGLKRSTIVKALNAEGLTGVCEGYQNLHLMPIFAQKIAYGSSNFPWDYESNRKDLFYGKGICPVAERLQDKTFMILNLCNYQLGKKELNLVCNAFQKVWMNLKELREYERKILQDH